MQVTWTQIASQKGMPGTQAPVLSLFMLFVERFQSVSVWFRPFTCTCTTYFKFCTTAVVWVKMFLRKRRRTCIQWSYDRIFDTVSTALCQVEVETQSFRITLGRFTSHRNIYVGLNGQSHRKRVLRVQVKGLNHTEKDRIRQTNIIKNYSTMLTNLIVVLM
jgi:hypothetical protein